MKPLLLRWAIPALASLLVAAGSGLTVWWLWFSGAGSAKAKNEPIPILVFDSLEHDFGALSPGTAQVSHSFTVSNSGRVPIQLHLRSLGCNCISVDCPDSVAPGATAHIGVNVEIRNREGPFRTQATLETSDPALPTVGLVIAFYAPPRIDVDPPSIQFGEVERGAKVEREVVVMMRLDGDKKDTPTPKVEITGEGISCIHKGAQITTDPMTGVRRAVHRFSVQLDTAGFSASNDPQYSTLSFSPEDAPVDTGKAVHVEWAFAHNRWLKGSTSATLSRGSDHPEVRVRLWSRDNKIFTLGKVVSASPEIQARAASTEPAAFQDVVISSYASPDKGEGFLKGYIDVYHAEHPEEPYRLTVLVLP
jgi:hypothetical protein